MSKWLLGYVGAVCMVGAITVVQNMWDLDKNAWASWAQAIGSAGAIGVALYIARRQIASEATTRLEASRTEAATTILSLQVMANELSRMCVLSFFQKQDPAEQIIYADAAGEFEAMANMFRDFPIPVVVAEGKMPELLQLRRIALEMKGILMSDTDLSGDQFVKRHRNRHAELHTSARRISINLADSVEEIAPGKFTSRIARRM